MKTGFVCFFNFGSKIKGLGGNLLQIRQDGKLKKMF